MTVGSAVMAWARSDADAAGSITSAALAGHPGKVVATSATSASNVTPWTSRLPCLRVTCDRDSLIWPPQTERFKRHYGPSGPLDLWDAIAGMAPQATPSRAADGPSVLRQSRGMLAVRHVVRRTGTTPHLRPAAISKAPSGRRAPTAWEPTRAGGGGRSHPRSRSSCWCGRQPDHGGALPASTVVSGGLLTIQHVARRPHPQLPPAIRLTNVELWLQLLLLGFRHMTLMGADKPSELAPCQRCCWWCGGNMSGSRELLLQLSSRLTRLTS
jgi:hypothetical protein